MSAFEQITVLVLVCPALLGFAFWLEDRFLRADRVDPSAKLDHARI
jgi:hypothetical protein